MSLRRLHRSEEAGAFTLLELLVVIVILVIPGLYYLFAKMVDGRKMIRDEHDQPLSETVEHADHQSH